MASSWVAFTPSTSIRGGYSSQRAAPRSFLWRGGQKDFAIGVWKGHGALVASFCDDPARRGQFALSIHQLLTNVRVVGGQTSGLSDALRANLG